ncbi:TetR/AcrR family transcriptional regulator [Streptomyces griseofuscus]|uniref:TetR family transcriptional regulator n=1 Tax=Streptomyces griseofuscus TaxID=146922 RepID=A0A7H1Q9P5_9ACTN|nr:MULTISPECIES: TetR/AcrR family transcriptional regulator [Streptomyces]MBA9044285.1 AcrR family transcriptional regulator [Streptomyces murinus]QNT97025.1 TetR family transcriptional regulator [Streptomyces griseofuscus]BBC97623.1 TetR/AcrR family transcriptional regulator [Streptomyces rochei]
MSPRSASVNEELRRRSRERLLQAAVELVDERGFEATTLGDIADRAGSARGLVSYYFPGKRHLVQSAVHRLMHRTLEEALEREPRSEDGRERLARAVDAILGLARDRPVLMRQHMAGLLQAEGFVECPEQRRLSELLGDTVARYGSADVTAGYPMLRAQLMGAVYAALVPGVPMPVPALRAELFQRYGLDWELGVPPERDAGCGAAERDLSRFFATGERTEGS